MGHDAPVDAVAAVGVIEGGVGRRLAEAPDPAVVADLRRYVARMAAIEGDPAGFGLADYALHERLRAHCANPVLEVLHAEAAPSLIDQVRRRMHEDPNASRPVTHRTRRSWERLVGLIAAGDPVGAQAHWRRHMEAVEAYLVERVPAPVSITRASSLR